MSPMLISKADRGITLLRPIGIFQELPEYDPGAEVMGHFRQGEKLRVDPDYLKGWVDRATLQHNQLVLKGWAADVQKAQPAAAIWVFVNGQLAHVGTTTIPRLDVTTVLKMTYATQASPLPST